MNGRSKVGGDVAYVDNSYEENGAGLILGPDLLMVLSTCMLDCMVLRVEFMESGEMKDVVKLHVYTMKREYKIAESQKSTSMGILPGEKPI